MNTWSFRSAAINTGNKAPALQGSQRGRQAVELRTSNYVVYCQCESVLTETRGEGLGRDGVCVCELGLFVRSVFGRGPWNRDLHSPGTAWRKSVGAEGTANTKAPSRKQGRHCVRVSRGQEAWAACWAEAGRAGRSPCSGLDWRRWAWPRLGGRDESCSDWSRVFKVVLVCHRNVHVSTQTPSPGIDMHVLAVT